MSELRSYHAPNTTTRLSMSYDYLGYIEYRHSKTADVFVSALAGLVGEV